MKKIRLNLEQLTVESFATERDRDEESGTIHGHDGESGVPLAGCVSLNGGCAINPTIGTGEVYCVCDYMVEPTDPGDDPTVG